MATPAPTPRPKRQGAPLPNPSSSRAGTRSRTTSDVSTTPSQSRPRPSRRSAAPKTAGKGKGKGKGKAPRSSALNPQLSTPQADEAHALKPPKKEAEDGDGDEADGAAGPESEWTARWNEEFFEIVDELPLELHRSFALIRELETKTQSQIARIGRDAIAYRDIRFGTKSQCEAPAPSTAKALRLSILRSIAESSADALRASEEKVGLAVSAYDWVDRHIRRLDNDLQKSESSLLLGLREGTEASRGVREALRIPVTAAAAAAAGDTTEAIGDESRAVNDTWADDSAMAASSVRTSPIARSSRRSSARSGSAGGGAVMAAVAAPVASSAGVASGAAASTMLPSAPARPGGAGLRSRAVAATALGTSSTAAQVHPQGTAETSTAQVPSSLVPDMAIDPNEPTYCYCDQVSFGDMVACDNEDCPREWYHLSCVGLDQPPPRHSKWYCLHCAPPGYRHAAPVDASLPFVPPEYKAAASGATRRSK